MNRWTWFTICVLLALLMLGVGWLMPVHLRGVEIPVLKQAGQHRRVTDASGFPNAAPAAWSDADQGLKNYFPSTTTPNGSRMDTFTDFVVREENRNNALKVLQSSRQPVVQELLQSRALTNMTTFAPSQAPGGEAFDTAVVVTGILLDQGILTSRLSAEINAAASQAIRTGNSEPLEQMLLDFLSLGQRFDWHQLVAFVNKTDDATTLHAQADLTRRVSDGLPTVFAAVKLSGDPKGVAHYLNSFPASGVKDLATVLPLGAGAVQELASHDKRLYVSPARQTISRYNPFAAITTWLADYCWRMPEFALILKWLLYFGGGFLLAMALHLARPVVSSLEAPLQVRGFHVAREILFALGFLLIVLLLSEPFLAQEGATAAMPFRLRIPTAGSAIQPGPTNTKTSFMEDKSKLLPMLLFFVLQALLYITCLVKLAEIRRQRVGPRMQLKLLENEEHLFDAGLYLGFLGTIVSFIIFSLYQRSSAPLMVAYSSTSFGILFVSFFKIFHLRPVRRRLLLEADAEAEMAATVVSTPATTPSPVS